MRIVSLVPSATEIVFALGLGDQVCGVSHECDHPPEARSKPVITRSLFDPSQMSSEEIDKLVSRHLHEQGKIYEIDLKAFCKARPDVVITQRLCEVCAVAYDDVLKALNSLSKRPTVIDLDPTCLGDVLNDIIRIGDATDRMNEAEELVASLKDRINRVASRAKGANRRPRVVCLEWLNPPMASGHWVPEMVDLAGGKEEMGLAGMPAARTDWDSVLSCDPEKLVVMPCGFNLARAAAEASEYLTGRPGLARLRSVNAGEVYAVDANAHFSRSGPRLIDGLEVVGKIIHPEIFGRPAEDQAIRIGR